MQFVCLTGSFVCCSIVCTVFISRLFYFLFLCGCASAWNAPDDFVYRVIPAGNFDIATWGKITDASAPVHVYIEGDGHSFDSRGAPTGDPTPHSTFLRDLAMSDEASNVVYMARPCQFIMSDSCTQTDWTDGRFSKKVIDSMATAVSKVVQGRPLILIGYSGGAMVAGLMIETHDELNVKKWITIAGVLNHKIWTDYFGDSPLSASLSLEKLPDVPQIHYVAEKDKVVPTTLTYAVAAPKDVVVVPGATHDDFGQLHLNFD